MPGYSISSDPDALEAYRIVFHHRRPFVFGHCSSDFSPANGLNLWRFPWPLGMAGASANLTGTGTDASAVRTQERSISVDSNRKASKLLGDFGHDHSIAPLFCAPSLTPLLFYVATFCRQTEANQIPLGREEKTLLLRSLRENSRPGVAGDAPAMIPTSSIGSNGELCPPASCYPHR